MPTIHDHQVCYEIAQATREYSDAQKQPVQKNSKCVCFTDIAFEMFHLTLHVETEWHMIMCAVSTSCSFALVSVATMSPGSLVLKLQLGWPSRQRKTDTSVASPS